MNSFSGLDATLATANAFNQTYGMLGSQSFAEASIMNKSLKASRIASGFNPTPYDFRQAPSAASTMAMEALGMEMQQPVQRFQSYKPMHMPGPSYNSGNGQKSGLSEMLLPLLMLGLVLATTQASQSQKQAIAPMLEILLQSLSHDQKAPYSNDYGYNDTQTNSYQQDYSNKDYGYTQQADYAYAYASNDRYAYDDYEKGYQYGTVQTPDTYGFGYGFGDTPYKTNHQNDYGYQAPEVSPYQPDYGYQTGGGAYDMSQYGGAGDESYYPTGSPVSTEIDEFFRVVMNENGVYMDIDWLPHMEGHAEFLL